MSKRKAELEAAAKDLGVDVEWCFVEGSARLVFTQQARCADVAFSGKRIHPAILGRACIRLRKKCCFRPDDRSSASRRAARSKELDGTCWSWNASRFAARAVADALPALEAADRVTVLSINPKRYEAAVEAAAIDAIAPHFQRHCRFVAFVAADLQERNIALEILAQATMLQADLVVAGGYGHPRLWEKMLGGVTRDLLTTTPLPLLMSH